MVKTHRNNPGGKYSIVEYRYIFRRAAPHVHRKHAVFTLFRTDYAVQIGHAAEQQNRLVVKTDIAVQRGEIVDSGGVAVNDMAEQLKLLRRLIQRIAYPSYTVQQII